MTRAKTSSGYKTTGYAALLIIGAFVPEVKEWVADNSGEALIVAGVITLVLRYVTDGVVFYRPYVREWILRKLGK